MPVEMSYRKKKRLELGPKERTRNIYRSGTRKKKGGRVCQSVNGTWEWKTLLMPVGQKRSRKGEPEKSRGADKVGGIQSPGKLQRPQGVKNPVKKNKKVKGYEAVEQERITCWGGGDNVGTGGAMIIHRKKDQERKRKRQKII